MLSIRRLDSLLLALGMGLFPVYIFPSGGIQPTHLLLLGFAVVVLVERGLTIELWAAFLFALCLYTFAIEGFYAIVDGDATMLVHSVYYFFNFLIATATYSYVKKNGLEPLKPGLIVAAAIALGAVLTGVVGARATGTFNNPNQLGYFSVCLVSLTFLLHRHALLRFPVASLLFSTAVYLSILSLSKAAMITCFLIIAFVVKPRKSPRATTVWMFSSLVAIAVVGGLYMRGVFDDYRFTERLQTMTKEADSSLAGRGYFAFTEGNAVQIVFGLGNRRVEHIVDHEVHSTFGSVFNNFGLIGLLLFCIVFAIWVLFLYKAYGTIGMFCLAGPPLLYGLTHNGARFTVFWILFGASMAMAQKQWTAKRQAARASSPSLFAPAQ